MSVVDSIDFSFVKEVALKDGRNILFRYPRLEDAQALMDYINPIIMEPTRILMDTPQTLEQEQAYLQSSLAAMQRYNEIKIFAVDNDVIVGVSDVRRSTYKNRHIGIFGITLHKAYRGVGLGTLLMNEALYQAKNVLKLMMVILTCNAENRIARELYEKMGFQEYGRLPGAILQQGIYEDEIFMYKML